MLPEDSCQTATRRGIYRNVLIASLLLLLSAPGYSATGPTVSSPAAANPNPVTGTTTALSVTGTDDAGGTDLTYTWSATGPSSGRIQQQRSEQLQQYNSNFSGGWVLYFTSVNPKQRWIDHNQWNRRGGEPDSDQSNRQPFFGYCDKPCESAIYGQC